MSETLLLPDYFVSPVPELWAIDERGEAIDWNDRQSTAIMLPHLQLLCRPLADQLKGLPSLSAILFVVDALSRGWSIDVASHRVHCLVRGAGRSTDTGKMSDQIMRWLHQLQRLDVEFRQGVPAHVAFLCELFEQLPREWLATSGVQTALALQWLENVVGDRGVLLSTRLRGEAQAASLALRTLDFGSMQGLDAQSLRLRMRTGLNELPESAALDVIERFPLAALARQISTGQDDLGAVARMAHSISAMLSLPRLPSDPDVLPMGGVSDVTNRGQPDRLLMSELALDSDLLIARIANGQALYLRREQPPQPEPKHRCLIVETGIRMWGQMRLYSAAFALGSCIAQERRGGEKIDIVTVAGNNAWVEDFTTRAGIERFYERLLADVHPGAALMDISRRKSLDLNLDSQPILVLSEATDRDAEFQRVTADFPRPHLFARIQPTGWVELGQRSVSGDTTLQRMRFENVVESARLKPDKALDLPAFLKLSPCPLRFSVQPIGAWVQTHDDGVNDVCWTLTHDGRAMLLDDRQKAAIEVGCVPSGRVLASSTPDSHHWLLVIESPPSKTTPLVHVLVEVTRGHGVRVCQLKLGGEKSAHVVYCFDRDELIRVGKRVVFLDRRSGAELASTERVHPHLGGAFFGDQSVYVASRYHDVVKLQRLGSTPAPHAGVVARLEQGSPVVYARDLSWMVALTGESPPKFQSTGLVIQTRHPLSIVQSNSSGTGILVELRHVLVADNPQLICKQNEHRLVRLSLKQADVSYAGQRTPDVLAAFQTSQHKFTYECRNVRNRIRGLSIVNDELVLHTSTLPTAIGNCRVEGKLEFCLKVVDRKTAYAPRYTFAKPMLRAGGPYCRWKLRHAKLPQGDAWLDSRGLLHLRALDGSQLSLILSDGAMAGWHSSGAVFGPQYFLAARESFIDATQPVVDWLSTFIKMQTCAKS